MNKPALTLLPRVLHEYPHWLVSNNKVPVIPTTNDLIRGNRIEQTISFEEAAGYIQAGIHHQAGILHTQESPLVSVDIDKVIVDDQPVPEVVPFLEKMKALGAYIELSTSGTGLRIPTWNQSGSPLAWSKKIFELTNRKDKERPKIELYNTNQYVIYTGNLYHPGACVPDFATVLAILEDLYPQSEQAKPKARPVATFPLGNGDWQRRKIALALPYIDPDCTREEWIWVGQALHDHFHGSSEGLAIWDQWSAGGAKYCETKGDQPEKRWKGFKEGKGITLGTLYDLAEKNGWVKPKPITYESVKDEAPPVGLPVSVDTQWPVIKPLPLKAILVPVKPITPQMLPDCLAPWVQDVAERMDHAPFEYAAITAVVAAGALIGRKLTVAPKQFDDWAVVPNLWGCCVGRPSVKKTPVIKAIMRPVSILEAEARERFERDMENYQVLEKLTQMQEAAAEKKALELVKKGNHSEAEALLMDKSGDPVKPVAARYIVNDSTIEKLGVLLSQNPKGLMLFRDELTGWLAGLDRDDRQQDRAFFLEAFNGDGTFSYDRITREDIFIPSNTVSIIGGIQPRKIYRLLSARNDGSRDDGLVERLQLLVYPDEEGAPTIIDRKPNKEVQGIAYAAFRKLDQIEYQAEEDKRPVIHFDSVAQKIFNDWYEKLIDHIRDNPIIDSHLGKYSSLMPSLACIFHVLENGVTGCIGQKEVMMAVQWCDALETHAMRVYSLADDPLVGARTLLDRLDGLPAVFRMAQLERKRWSGLIRRGDRERAVNILCKHGYLVREEHKGEGRPSITYKVNPASFNGI